MNKDRRKMIADALELLERAKGMLEDASGEERDYFDNMPESLQGGDKGSAAEAAADSLDEAVSQIEEAISSAESATE